MKRIVSTLIIFNCLILGGANLKAQGSFPLNVSVGLPIPYPTRLSDFTDIESTIFIIVDNESSESFSIVLTGKLENDARGISIKTDPGNPPDHEIFINPGHNRLNISDLEDLFDPNHLIMQGTSAADIRSDAALPEGEYTLCIRAFDAANPGRALSPDPEMVLSACALFNVSYLDAPEIMVPGNDESISTTSSIIPIRWVWNRPAIPADNISFTLRIVEMDPSGRDPNDVLASSTTPDLFYEEGIMETFKDLHLPVDVLLEPGRSYVIQVIATDDTGELRFKNGGRSVPVVFTYQEPLLSIGGPRWITESGITLLSAGDVELEYEIPLPEGTELEIIKDIYIFEVPEGMDPEIAYDIGEVIDHNHIDNLWNNDANPSVYNIIAPSMVYGNTYGAKIIISDSDRRDEVFFDNGGESEILIFHYGESTLVPKPYWITEQETAFESTEEVELEYRIQLLEGHEMPLDAVLRYFEIPSGTSAEMAAENESARNEYSMASGTTFDDSPLETVTAPNPDRLEAGKRYGAYIEISDPTRQEGNFYRFENNGRSEILVFSTGGTDVLLTYPVEGDRLPFSFFPLIARYQPFNTQYQHWKSETTLLKNGSRDDYFTGDGLRWPGGSMVAQRTLTGLSDITESESQNIAVFKNNSLHPAPFDRGALYRWEANVKLYDEVEPTSPSTPLIEVERASTFSRGMGPSDLSQPGYGAIIAPDSTFNFIWITADAPEKLLAGHRINHATRRRIDYFNGIVDEKWVLEVDTTDAFNTVIFHQEGRIGRGEIDYLSGDFSEESIISELYKELESAETFTPPDTGYYHWRVKWLEDPNADWTSAHYESSQKRPFWVGNSPPPETSSRSDTPGACVSECLAAEITNETALSDLSTGSTVSVGNFQMSVTELSSSSAGRFSGRGEIPISFLNNIRILVEFEDIRINNEMQMYGGKVVAINDVPSISMDSSTVTIGGQPIVIPSMSETESQILDVAITSTERLVSLMTDERPIGMPIGFDNEIDGSSYVIGITEMIFKAREAELTAVMRMDIPSLGDHIPALGAKGVCFTPDGLGDEGRLYLHRDWTLTPDESDVQFSFSGCEDGDTTRSTYVEWDCAGYKCMSIRGEVEFPSDMLLKEDADGNILEGEMVVADFGAKTCRGGNWIADIGIEPFQVNGMDGWGFSTVRAYLDCSDIENPPSISFPENYNMSHLGIGPSTSEEDAGRMENTWKGFYLAEVMMHAPSDFEHDVLGRPEFGVQNLIIEIGNGGGVTGSIVGRDILAIEDGSVDNLSFSLDSVYISIVQSSMFEGGLKGKVGLPIFEAEDYLNYEGLLAYNPSVGVSFNFNVNVSDTLNIPMWDVAEIYLSPESTIGIERKAGTEGLKTYVYTDLSGGLNIIGDLGAGEGGGVPGVDFKGIRFEHIVYNSDGSQFDIGSFSFTSDQKNTAGFPVNINDIGINLSLPRVGITFDLALTLMDAGFSAEAGFGIYGALDITGDREIFQFDGVDLESIEIHQEISSVRLDGRLDFYNGDAVYGDGIKGSLAVVMPMGLAASLTVQFGTKKREGVLNPEFNTADYFPYWYVDGLVVLPAPGIVVFSGFAVYGFGGGVYYRMRPDYTAIASTSSMMGEERVEAPTSGVTYVPDWNTLFGFKIMAVLGTSPDAQVFNMDVGIEMNFNASGGLGLFAIDGAGYVMASFAERPDAKVRATLHFEYSNPGDGSKRVAGNFAIYVDFGEYLHGIEEGNRFVYAELLVQDDIWYYYMGKPDNRGGLEVDLTVLSARLDAYLMIGHGIPRRLPPLPEFIANLVYGPQQLNDQARAADVNAREHSIVDEMKMSSAKGFAFGASLSIEARFEFAIFYTELEAMFGFDVLVSEDSERICAETGVTPGINNWYAMGQMYAGLRGEMGVFVDLFFIQGEFPIIELAAAVAMRGGLPNPTWIEGRAGLYYSILGGMIEGQCNFKVQVGEKCSVVDENPLSSIDFIADIQPGDGSNPDVFVIPAVAFNLPVNKLLELPAGLDDDPSAVRVFEPYIERFELTDLSEGNSLLTGEFEFNETNTIASLVMEGLEVLKGESRYKVEIVVKSFEIFPDGSRRNIKDGGRDWEDRKALTFVTGPRPRDIPESNVLFSYPIKNQAYFLQGEVDGSSGIRWTRPQTDLFAGTIDDVEYSYVARVKPVSGGEALELPLGTSVKGVSFALPNLQNEEYYMIQIVRKLANPVLLADIDSRTTAVRNGPLSPMIRNFNLGGGGGNVKVNLEAQELPGLSVARGESLLYHYYFRTSKFNTLSEKVAGLNLQAETSLIGAMKLMGETGEPFEEFDLKGYFKGGTKILEALVSIQDPFSFEYHSNIANPKVYDLYFEVRNLKYSDPILSSMPFEYGGNRDVGFPPKKAVYLASSMRIEHPLQDWELEREAGIGQTGPTTTSTGSGTSSLPTMASGHTAGLSGLFGGSTGNINISSAYIGGGSSNYGFALIYTSSTFIKLDADAIKRKLSTILSYRGATGAYTYQNQLLRQHPAVYSKIFYSLTNTAATFDFTPGSYGVVFEVMVPTLNGGSSEFPHQTRKSAIMKRFDYLQASQAAPPVTMPKPRRKRKM